VFNVNFFIFLRFATFSGGNVGSKNPLVFYLTNQFSLNNHRPIIHFWWDDLSKPREIIREKKKERKREREREREK